MSVRIPACEPVNETASWPRSLIAIETSAIEIRSPAVSSMSSSRGSGRDETCAASSISSSVVWPIAETTAQTLLPVLGRAHDPAGDALDLLGPGDRGAAVLLDDDGHGAETYRRA